MCFSSIYYVLLVVVHAICICCLMNGALFCSNDGSKWEQKANYIISTLFLKVKMSFYFSRFFFVLTTKDSSVL